MHPVTLEIFPWDTSDAVRKLRKEILNEAYMSDLGGVGRPIQKIQFFIDEEIWRVFRLVVRPAGRHRLIDLSLRRYLRINNFDFYNTTILRPINLDHLQTSRPKEKFETILEEPLFNLLLTYFARRHFSLLVNHCLREYLEWHLGPLSDFISRTEQEIAQLEEVQEASA